MIELIESTDMGDYLLVTTSGTIETVEEWKEADMRAADLIRSQKHRRVIADERNLIHKQSVIAVTQLVRQVIDEMPQDFMGLRLAAVVNAKSRSIADFWETYSVNRGYNWRAFEDMSQAITFISSR